MDKVSFKRFLSLYAIYAKMDLVWLLRDTKFAILAIASDIVSSISSMTAVFLLAWRFGGIGGMGKYEVLFMLGYANIVFGLILMFGANNNVHISRIIGRGQLEHMFVQPLPLGTQLVTGGFFPFTCSSNLLSGVIVLVVAIVNLKLALPWWWALSLVLNVFVSVTFVVGLAYLSSSLTFYAPVQCEEITTYIISSAKHLSTFPLSGMPLYLQLPLITVFPAGLIAWFPTLALLGKPTLGVSQAFPVFAAIALALIAAYFFKKGLNFYARKGINRYTAAGRN